ncbi:MAG: DNA adenine methylase, partial [Myxococcales bacterium]|nr:DNA adenine methylase [Myxococcales bacterium]
MEAALARARAFVEASRPEAAAELVLGRARSFLALVRGEEDVEKSLWGSPAGKRHLAPRIVAAIPRHRVYVEPFAGGAQVFWAKEPSEVEVLADRDPEIAFAFRFVKGLTPKKLDRLKRRSWVGDAERFRKLYESEPDDDVERFYRFAYLAYFSFNKLRRGTMPDKHAGVEARFIDRLEKFAPRLKDVVVRCADYEDVVEEFDAPDAFFFLDPPYPGYDADVGHEDWDEKRFGKVLRRIDGRFLVTYGIRSEGAAELFKGFHVDRWRHTSSVGSGPGSGARKSVTLVATNYRIQKAAEPEDRQMQLPNIASAQAVEKTIWGSPAGKKRLAARLVKLIPPHKVYVEPFAGSAAVFFEKEPVELEVLGDADPEIASAFKAIKTLTDDEFEALRERTWIGSERTFKALLDARPRSKVEKLYRFLYLAHFSYGKMRGKSFNTNATGVEARTVERIETFRGRLRGVKVRHAHYAEIVKEFDGKDTFFYLDPPYIGHNVEIGEDTFDEVEFRKVLDGIKGKFLVTYGTRGELDTKGFHVRKIRPPRIIRAMRGVGGPKTLPTLLIANYAITEKSLGGGWDLDDVLDVIDVDGTDAGDVPEVVKARVEALAVETSKLEIAEVHPERLRAVSDEELLSVHRRLHQLFGGNFAGNDRLSAGDLKREDIVNAEVFVQDEMARRGMRHEVGDELAVEADVLRKYEPDQPRDEGGRFSETGGGAGLSPSPGYAAKVRTELRASKPVSQMGPAESDLAYRSSDPLTFAMAERMEAAAGRDAMLAGLEAQATWNTNYDSDTKDWLAAQRMGASDSVSRTTADAVKAATLDEANFRAIQERVGFTQEWVRQTYGERVIAYRGIKGRQAGAVQKALEEAEAAGITSDQINLAVHGLSSFTTSKTKAFDFAGRGGVVVQTSISYKEVFLANDLGAKGIIRYSDDHGELVVLSRKPARRVNVISGRKKSVEASFVAVTGAVPFVPIVDENELNEWHRRFQGRLPETTKRDGDLAPIHPSGEVQGREITLEEVLPHFESFKLRMPFLYLVGGLANNGRTRNDIDVLVRGRLPEEMRKVIEFRLGRMLPPELSGRLQPLDDEHAGPFTSHVELADLVVEVRPKLDVKRMRLIEKQDDPLLDLPQARGPQPAVLQYHFRGRSVHGDLRLRVNDHLVGWTLSLQRPGAIAGAVDTVEEARRIARSFTVEGDRYAKPLVAPAKVFATPKARQPVVWLDIDGEVFGEGEVGATAEEKGVIVAIDHPKVEWGLQKPFSHEYFFSGGRELAGIMHFRLLTGQPGEPEEEIEAGRRSPEGEAFWTAFLSKDLLPSVLKPRAVETRSMPPDGYSAIPVSLERVTPKEHRYWEAKGEEARGMRDALVESGFFTADNIRLVDAEFRRVVEKLFLFEAPEEPEPSTDDIEKAKEAPFSQWGGSSKYAKKLAARLPDHARYVEPFCGSAAVFFAKEPADEEVLADADPEVVFAHRYIQRLDKRAFAALERLIWKVSRAGLKRARECEPRSDAERFWKLVYGRLCAWGGKSNMSGFSTIHEGQTYKLDELWRFQERLKGVRLVTKDWKKTLAECDGAGTLFFIDPPYVEEWDMENGIPPEDIAAEVAKLKGDYVIAYTDSARARRALSKVGRPFKMRFLEARHAGLWKTRSRLFVSSCKLRKLDDVEWLDEDLVGLEKQREVDFTLSWQFWKGQTVIRAAPSRQVWHLALDRSGDGLDTWVLQADPLSGEERITAVAIPRRSKELLAFDGDVAPGQTIGGDVLNDTKATPSTIRIQDRGRAVLIDDQRTFKKVRFEGQKLRGVFTLTAEEAGSDIWQLARGQDPGRVIPEAKAEVPVRDGVQVWDPARKDPDVDRAQLRPLAIFQPMKPAPRSTNEFREVEAALAWATPEMLKGGVAVEPKFNGFRVVLEKAGDKVLVFTEDTKRDISPALPNLS